MGSHDELFGEGEKAAKLGFLAVALIGLVKGTIGYISGSVSLLAQSVDSLMDLFSLIAVYMGMRLSRKPPSERFPYGYYKIENLASLLIAVTIILTGGGLLWESAKRVIDPMPISSPLYAVAVAGLSIPLLYTLYRYTRRVGEEINSQALLGQAADFRTDIYSSALVLVGVSAAEMGYPIVEGIAGFLISLFVLRLGTSLAWRGLLVLMDAVVNPERLMEIKELAEGVRGVKGVSHVRMRRSGPFCFGELTIGVDQDIPVEQAHRLTEELEQKIREKMPSIESIVIHIEPSEQKSFKVVIPIEKDRGLSSPTTPHFGKAPYFLFVEIEEGSIEKWVTRKNTALELEKKRGITISDLILGEKATTLLTNEIGEGPLHILWDSFVDIYDLPENVTAEEAVKDFIAGTLKVRSRTN